MGQFKKIVAVVISAVVMTASVGVSVDATTVGSTSKMTTGGTSGRITLKAVADKEYFTPSTAGYYGYRYGVTVSLFPSPAKADVIEIYANFCTSTTTYEISEIDCDVNSCELHTSLAESSSQYVSAQFTSYVTSSEYGNTDIYLNVAY